MVRAVTAKVFIIKRVKRMRNAAENIIIRLDFVILADYFKRYNSRQNKKKRVSLSNKKRILNKINE